jgi:hypothetical protein
MQIASKFDLKMLVGVVDYVLERLEWQEERAIVAVNRAYYTIASCFGIGHAGLPRLERSSLHSSRLTLHFTL